MPTIAFECGPHVGNPVGELHTHRINALTNLRVSFRMPLFTITAFLIRQPPNQISDVVTKPTPNIIDGGVGVLDRIMHPGGGHLDRVGLAELRQSRYHTGQMVVEERAITVFLSVMRLRGKSPRLLNEIFHSTLFAEAVKPCEP